MSFEHRIVGKDEHWSADAAPGEDITPDERATANAIKAQGLAGSHEALDRAFSFIVVTATREQLPETQEPPSEDAIFSHSLEMFGCLDGTVAENADIVYQMWEFMVEKYAQSFGVPEVLALAEMSRRWLVEHGGVPE